MKPRNVGASVRQRLLNQAQTQGRPFQELLQYFAMERFLYRLSQSSYAHRFVLKGALLMTAWRAPMSRPTLDIDLAGRTSNDLEHIRLVIAELPRTEIVEDGLEFAPGSVEVGRIREDAEYEGVRARFTGVLAGARIPMQVDIGFGDVIVPEPATVEYPTMLEFPAPVLIAYPKEAVVAEKLEAITTLGMMNSRMKDFFDIAFLARLYPFDGRSLREAIRATFGHRGIRIEREPVGLTSAYLMEPSRAVQWKAFLRRSRMQEKALNLGEVVSEVRRFAIPVLENAASENEGFDRYWTPEGHWK